MDLRPLSARELSLAAALALGACGDNLQPYTDPPSIDVVSMPALPWPEVDILVVVDDSANTSSFQVSLADGFDTLLDRLEAAAGAIRHVGVATTDLGATGSNDPDHPGASIGSAGNGGCAGHGKDGVLQTSGIAAPEGYVIDEGPTGARQRNYPGELVAAVGQMIRVGAGGCGFEQPLAAIDRALTNPVNAGFVRADAHLVVVMLGDEDDCSFRDPALLGPESPELGPQQSFRCTRFGLACDEDLNTLERSTTAVPRRTRGSSTGCSGTSSSSEA
ncbi:MAG: hypothetical protein IPQ07_35760 [Myxococcales bacterium]|nr:hypothetical protein [Myxococcales bacterium]